MWIEVFTKTLWQFLSSKKTRNLGSFLPRTNARSFERQEVWFPNYREATKRISRHLCQMERHDFDKTWILHRQLEEFFLFKILGEHLLENSLDPDLS